MALFLGLPYAVPEYLLAAQDGIYGMNDEHKALHKLNLICGHIVDRNRGLDPPYLETMRIAEEMEALRAKIPEAWCDLDSTDSNLPLGVVFQRRATVFVFHYMNKLLHLPYVLRARHDDRYHYSRAAVLSSAEIMLNAWRKFPCCNNLPVACDYLDFCAFTAAIVLAADLVSLESCWPADEERRQWGLITGTAELM